MVPKPISKFFNKLSRKRTPVPFRPQSPVPQSASNATTVGPTSPSSVAQNVTATSSALPPTMILQTTSSITMLSLPSGSSTVMPPVSQVASPIAPPGNQLNQATLSSSSRLKEAAGVTWEGVKAALVLLNESSGWLPPLKAAVGGLVALIDAIELTSSNAADLEILRQKIDGLTSIIDNSRDRTFPWLRRRLSEFAEKLDEIVESIDEKSNHGRLRRFAEGKKDKEDITAFAGAISDLVTNLQSELTLHTSRGINELLSCESLKKLKESESAHYDTLLSANLVQRRGCTPKTRQEILEDLMKWAKNPHSSRMYWMNGMAGTGKTTIAYSFCEQLQEKGLLGANFFCSRSLAECSDIRRIIPTTARQLARSCPQFAPALLEILGGDFQLSSHLRNQLKRLLSDPFQHISEPVTDTLIIVIDALDECSNEATEVCSFLEQICSYFTSHTIPLKMFLTSRPEPAIRHTITPVNLPSSEWSVVHIHDIEKSLVQADIKVYVEDELTRIAKARRLEDGWPPGTEVDVVVSNANRLFIYASTVIRYVKGNSGNPRRRLSEMASSSRVEKGTSQRSIPTTELIDELYRTILERALGEKNPEENQVARMVLKLIVCAQTPLTLGGIADLLDASGEFEIEISTSDVRTALELLPSVISTPMDDDGVATTFHASFPDFLFDNRRCGPINYIPLRQSHQDLARLCLHFMNKSLTVDNISGSDRWQTADDIIREKKVESWISSTLAYACMYWASHIDTNDEVESLSTELDRFLAHQLLRWLEVLSLLRRLDIGVEILQRMKEREHPTLSYKFDDAHQFLKDIFDIINVWPCEVFHSGLAWAPERSFIRKTYLKIPPVRIICGRRVDWGACELTIRRHPDNVASVAVSPDHRHVVSGSWDETVRIWNASTGEEELVLRGHSRWVTSVAVSPDNRHVVSGSYDDTVRIWNALTGEEEHVLRGHFSYVSSVAVSPDNRHVVSGSEDGTVRIWNALTGEEEHVLQGNFHNVQSVAVSPDNRHVVFGSWDNTARIWNVLTGEEEHVLRGHSDKVQSVAVSPDNLHVVSGSDDHTVRLWNALTGEQEHVLRGHSDIVRSVAVSPDSLHVVSGSADRTVRIWNALTGENEHVLRGHTFPVNSVAVSPGNRHIVSGSSDRTIRIWRASTGEEEHILQGHSNNVSSIAVSPDNRHVVSGSWDKSVRIWNAFTGEEVHILWGHSEWVVSVAVSPDSRHVVSGSWDKSVRIWNALTGKEEHILGGHSGWVTSVAVSPDNRHVVSGSSDKSVRIWKALTGEEEHILWGHSSEVTSVAVSPDNRHVVSGSADYTVRIWNALTGEKEHVIQHSSEVSSVAVSPDNCHVVSGSWDNSVRIWNSTGEGEHRVAITFVVSPDNCHVVFGPRAKTLPIQDSFLPSMVTSIALWAPGDDIASRPVIQRLGSGERLDLHVFLQEMRNGLFPVPITLTPDRLSILLSNGKKCLTIPSSLRDISCVAFVGSKVYFGHESGRVTILDV